MSLTKTNITCSCGASIESAFTSEVNAFMGKHDQCLLNPSRATSYAELDKMTSDLQELCDKQALRIGNLEMMAAVNAGREIKLAMAEANDERLARRHPACFADWQDSHATDRDCGNCNLRTECRTGQPEQEPVAWMYKCWSTTHLVDKKLDHYFSVDDGETYVKGVPLYTAPPQRKPLIDWVSVDDRLPESGGYYLVTVDTDDGPHVDVLLFNEKRKHWEHEGEPTFCHSYYFSPTHWAHRPEPAKEFTC